MLGSVEQNHERGEPVSFLSYKTVSEVMGSVSGDSPYVPVEDLVEFPPEGTALVGRELFHWTRHRGAGLEMPTASEESGARDGRGAGLFRGRYGSGAEAHGPGTLVIQHPFRYWDRFTLQADAPELSYFGFEVDQPAAYWRRVFCQTGELAHAGPRIGILQRTDSTVPWDADPEVSDGLVLIWADDASLDLPGEDENEIGSSEFLGQEPVAREGVWIGAQSGRVEWRVFVEYGPDSFDYELGANHGWKMSPRLELFGTEYFAPGRTLRRVTR